VHGLGGGNLADRILLASVRDSPGRLCFVDDGILSTSMRGLEYARP
jgi:hypothetical protein